MDNIMLYNTIKDPDIQSAVEKLKIARQQESLALPEYLDIAIERTNLAQKELDLLLRAKKLSS